MTDRLELFQVLVDKVDHVKVFHNYQDTVFNFEIEAFVRNLCNGMKRCRLDMIGTSALAYVEAASDGNKAKGCNDKGTTSAQRMCIQISVGYTTLSLVVMQMKGQDVGVPVLIDIV